MEDKLFLAKAKKIIGHFRLSVESHLATSPDKQRLLQLADGVLLTLSNQTRVNNKILIEMEKFYQSTSMIIGLSLSDSKCIYSSWREYDAFHFEYVKPNLKVYGNTFLI
ncbi:hypothetical protein CAC02_04020 [Streptococcus gallolyticus]|uniref:BlpT protein, fusion n=1 Tax=Streptococcus gallolyticus TaxID=315405 RepID=A0A368UH46_9STRE|nr:helicase BlpT [Streptococcus gallolyticus]RCW17293.1 hypothetical protein CAC02_04020 [Streptococcus gallolyticus]